MSTKQKDWINNWTDNWLMERGDGWYFFTLVDTEGVGPHKTKEEARSELIMLVKQEIDIREIE